MECISAHALINPYKVQLSKSSWRPVPQLVVFCSRNPFIIFSGSIRFVSRIQPVQKKEPETYVTGSSSRIGSVNCHLQADFHLPVLASPSLFLTPHVISPLKKHTFFFPRSTFNARKNRPRKRDLTFLGFLFPSSASDPQISSTFPRYHFYFTKNLSFDLVEKLDFSFLGFDLRRKLQVLSFSAFSRFRSKNRNRSRVLEGFLGFCCSSRCRSSAFLRVSGSFIEDRKTLRDFCLKKREIGSKKAWKLIFLCVLEDSLDRSFGEGFRIDLFP